MNPEEYITIKVDEPLLKKYFDFTGIPANKGNYSIKRKYYDQVKDLLSEYGIIDQECIDNFCFLEMIFWGQSTWARNLNSNKEEKAWKDYINDLSEFGVFLKKNTITGILFKGINDKKEADSISLSDPKFIVEVMESLSKMIYKSGIYDSEKTGPGTEVKLSGKLKREHFSNLLKYLKALPFIELNDLTETNENYFAGRFFTIASIFKPFPEEDENETAYKSPKDYYVKRMKKYR